MTGSASSQPDAYRHRVEEQAQDLLDPVDLGGTTCDGRPEDDVAPVGEAAAAAAPRRRKARCLVVSPYVRAKPATASDSSGLSAVSSRCGTAPPRADSPGATSVGPSSSARAPAQASRAAARS